MSDTISQEEVVVYSLQSIKTIREMVDRIADYYYIYGPDRSHFTASWNGHLRDAAARDCPDGDKADYTMMVTAGIEPTDKYFWSRRAIVEMLKDASEYSSYDFLNKGGLILALCRQMQVAYESNKRKQFTDKLAGKEPRRFE